MKKSLMPIVIVVLTFSILGGCAESNESLE